MTAQAKAVQVVVRGRVQRVGYRRLVVDAAQERGLAGYVRNRPDDAVAIFVQGGAKPVKEFLKVIRRPPVPVVVKAFEWSEAKPRPRVRYFRMRPGTVVEELQEGFGAMEAEFRDYRAEFREFRGDFRDYRNEFRDYRSEFRSFAGRTDANFQRLEARYGEISEKLTKVMETLEREGTRTREELTRAVDRLSELVAEFIRERRSRAP